MMNLVKVCLPLSSEVLRFRLSDYLIMNCLLSYSFFSGTVQVLKGGRFFLGLTVFTLVSACTRDTKQPSSEETLFQKLSSDETGIHFRNTLDNVAGFDVFRYHNFYNGGGVGMGDFNNDGLADIYLTSNRGENKLYLNKGNWKFEDITEKAGVAGSKFWSTGVSIADVNADGFLDIYVCNAGDGKGVDRENELYINNGDLTFTEKAHHYGLADSGLTTHAVFFDYDKDGDIDCYVLNNSSQPVSSLGYRNLREVRDESGGHRLYRNDNGTFVNVSEQAGIFGSVIGFGLGVMVGDINQDNWPDLYVSNDFYERDYLYINNQDGTFIESLEKYMGHISMFSMGADLADLNNDGYPEVFSTDMLPFDDYRLKTLTAFETFDIYQLRLKNGYYHQYMRNMLHLNNQDGTFSEIGQLAGVSATDWSWGALIADFNNDLTKEIYVCNGIYKDVTNQDFVEHLGSGLQMRALIEGNSIDYETLVDEMPSEKVSNVMFTSVGDMQYTNVAQAWGLDEPSFSNGAAYGDLDNDGDLDLVVNNVNQEVFVYRNFSQEKKQHHFLGVVFKGNTTNPFGLGARVKAFVGQQVVMVEHMPIRGFQSSMDYKLILGLGSNTTIDSLEITWPDNTTEIQYSVRADQVLLAVQANAKGSADKLERPSPLFVKVNGAEIVHRENDFNDFDRDRLQYSMLSTQGPAFAKADLNGDGLDDFFLGGSVGQPGKIVVQKPGKVFMETVPVAFEADSLAENTDAVFFDADGDHDLDLYVVSGGSEYGDHTVYLADQLYFNTGFKNGIPQYIKGTLPEIYQSGSCVRPVDVDHDGDLDLFVGTRVIASTYGTPCDQFILINDGRGNFSDETKAIASAFKKLGMVTDAVWFDYDNNGFDDLLVVGEWMPITLFLNDGKQLKKTTVPGLAKTNGWWNSIHAADLDNDGDLDFVLGNLGQNSKFKPTPEAPMNLYVNDFDQNGSVEPVFTFTSTDSKEFPLALRPDIIKQMSSFKRQFVYYKDYAGKTVEEIYTPGSLSASLKSTFYEPRSVVLWNEGSRGFSLSPLPVQAQVAPVFGIAVLDVNHDGFQDIVVGGNFYAMKPEVGRYDALHGLVLLGDGLRKFAPLSSWSSGLKIEGEVRHIGALKAKGSTTLAFIRNNDSVQFYSVK